MNPFPLLRSVLILDNASVHTKQAIYALCAAHGIMVIFLPPYSYDYNPIEKAFHEAKAYMRKVFDRGGMAPLSLAAKLKSSLEGSVSAEKACNFFQHCHIQVSEEDRKWAMS